MSTKRKHDGASIIDGKAISVQVRKEAKERADQAHTQWGVRPGVAVVIVGDRKDSQTYVRNKQAACEECGIASTKKELKKDCTQEELLEVVKGLNEDASIHAILVQLPLPEHLSESEVLGAISPQKDVDGFHPINVGMLAMRGREAYAEPCTPKGVMELLKRSSIHPSGKRAVVVGRSNVVGTPMALMLIRADATVQVVHSRTPKSDLEACIGAADIVVVAAGVRGLVKGEWVKEGATVIDVGINPVPDDTKKSGYRLVGDVDFESVSQRAGSITPVPGGVGPMTIAMLMHNTVDLMLLHMKGAPKAPERFLHLH
mmetsp:Transcript_21762/g.50513  ORF Transcript_21762/g.50513 Transcript_21762/m.50513 type:complete len:315 (+) Transcript_21762:24-968(+)